MANLATWLIGLALVANLSAASSIGLTAVTGTNVTAHDTNSAVETEFQKLMDADDAAKTEVDGWIQENQKFAAQGAPIPAADLNRRILKRFEPVRKGYED